MGCSGSKPPNDLSESSDDGPSNSSVRIGKRARVERRIRHASSDDVLRVSRSSGNDSRPLRVRRASSRRINGNASSGKSSEPGSSRIGSGRRSVTRQTSHRSSPSISRAPTSGVERDAAEGMFVMNHQYGPLPMGDSAGTLSGSAYAALPPELSGGNGGHRPEPAVPGPGGGGASGGNYSMLPPEMAGYGVAKGGKSAVPPFGGSSAGAGGAGVIISSGPPPFGGGGVISSGPPPPFVGGGIVPGAPLERAYDQLPVELGGKRTPRLGGDAQYLVAPQLPPVIQSELDDPLIVAAYRPYGRNEADIYMADKQPGHFILRPSSSGGGATICISYIESQPPDEGMCKHCLVRRTDKGYVFHRSRETDKEPIYFARLRRLLVDHQIIPEQ